MYHHDVQHYCLGRPPLHYAIDFGIPFLTKALLPQKDNINTPHHGVTALHEAARRGDIDTCMSLLDQGASLELKSGGRTRGMTALHFAAENGHPQLIKLLLDKGASPHTESMSQPTPFYRAARSGSLEALRLLYLAGSDINATTWDNWTALYDSIGLGLVYIASQLLGWGADPTIVTLSGDGALKHISAARHNDHTINRSHENIMLNMGAESEQDLHFWEVKEKREAETLQEIEKLQAQAQACANETGDTFFEYICNMEQTYWRLERIENDTRPGIERDLSRLKHEDVGELPKPFI
jgi:ankyrin repeat protein